MLSHRRPALGPAPLRPARDGAADRGGQDAVELVEIRLEVVGDDQDRSLGRPLLAADAVEAAAARLEVRHPDRVFIGHPHREPAGEGLDEPEAAVQRAQGTHPVEVDEGVAAILVVDEPRHRLAQHGMKRLRELRLHPRGQIGEVRAAPSEGGGALGAKLGPAPRGRAGLRGRPRRQQLDAGLEPAHVALHRDAALADGGLEVTRGHGQRPATRQCAQQQRVDLALVLPREGQPVEAHEAPRQPAGRRLERLAGKHPVARRRLLGDREEPVRARDHGGAGRRGVVHLDGAPRLEQLGGDDHVDVARGRVEREDRLRRAGGQALRKYLDVVGGGAGALGHARDRGGLRGVAGVGGRADDPLGQHAAAVPAEGRDEDRDRAGRRRHAGWSQPITRRRAAATPRAHAPGLWTTRAS
jgi:hypothetical protein